MQKTFNEAMDFRHACKLFDENRKISSDEIGEILEAGRKSPSSFGMEPWKFLVVTNEELKASIRPHCWNQPQITTCSHLVVILAAIESLKVQSGVVEKRFSRREMSKEQLDFYMDKYSNHLNKTLSSDENIFCWSARQTYIAAANMMTCAAALGIDSCPIEGFDKDDVERVLELDASKYQLSLIIPFGYRVKEQSSQLRLPFEEVVEFKE
ncbi:NAD(P)H-dependent oxidoreductase [Sulfurimonas sp.]|jgi:nitroreductase|uniref:NAD(P)H-dependent oxidoreductase n=1 Tax=Sulfurimonas sp. TaxID=2022749 RepID=UPI0025DAA9C4|nr:NAD(P)H-dependent oxidoreductase [Sulfurimonas sp.]MCK9474062.1 NAD(P)H-dependent oxidoreductase [Sulfurimonas sp.]MDD3505909.1 NAD(P)H-dependent oxidoreductase [Sulfurimonas sp.]